MQLFYSENSVYCVLVWYEVFVLEFVIYVGQKFSFEVGQLFVLCFWGFYLFGIVNCVYVLDYVYVLCLQFCFEEDFRCGVKFWIFFLEFNLELVEFLILLVGEEVDGVICGYDGVKIFFQL